MYRLPPVLHRALRPLALLAIVCATAFGPQQGQTASVANLPPALAPAAGDGPLAAEFRAEVSPRLSPPPDAVAGYAAQLELALTAAAVKPDTPRYLLLVDRSPRVQAALLYWGPTAQGWHFVGAAPVSTGLPGRFEHFTTPLGVFEHSMANPDFRSLGTRNKLGFRGYGSRGMRIYDFGWIHAPRGWGDGAMGVLRLQMHATDPDRLARRLGTAQSEGCIRIPEPLNAFIDHHGLLDEDYEKALASGPPPGVLRTDRQPTPTPGRYVVVIDSGTSVRPDWSPLPAPR